MTGNPKVGTEPPQVSCDGCGHDHMNVGGACTVLDCRCYEPIFAAWNEAPDPIEDIDDE